MGRYWHSKVQTIPNRVSLDEIDYITKGSETVVLGEGCFGKCFLARFKRNGVLVAVKIGQKYGKRYSDPLKIEVKMLSQLCHPNIPFFFGITDEKLSALFTEFYGDINKHKSMTVSQPSQNKNLDLPFHVVRNCV